MLIFIMQLNKNDFWYKKIEKKWARSCHFKKVIENPPDIVHLVNKKVANTIKFNIQTIKEVSKFINIII